jgi:hypothetical protein
MAILEKNVIRDKSNAVVVKDDNGLIEYKKNKLKNQKIDSMQIRLNILEKRVIQLEKLLGVKIDLT